MDISIIVPARNEEKTLAACLKAIRSQETEAEYELIVCDGESTDATPEIAEQYADKVVSTHIHDPAAGRNHGAENSCGKYLVFIDADTIITPDYIQNVFEHFTKDPSLLGFSAGFIFSKRSEKLIVTEKITNRYLAFRDRVGITTLTGFNLAVRRKHFEILGGFRDIPLEDGDFSIRLRKIGKIRYITKFYVITSSRRLDDLGLLGTLKYYLEIDLAARNKKISKLLTYTDYKRSDFNDSELDREFERLFESKTPHADNGLIDRVYKKTGLIKEKLQKKEERFIKRTAESLKIIADIKLKAKVNPEDIERAIRLAGKNRDRKR